MDALRNVIKVTINIATKGEGVKNRPKQQHVSLIVERTLSSFK